MMSNEVFANGLEVACKAADGKSIACFPDVCFTPPSPPAGWIPVPYANTAYAKDTANASKTVMISGKPIMKKDVSYFKTSTGNEPAAGPKGIITGQKKGKAYFTSWSMNVKIEGQNVDRHSDLTTHNHGSKPGNTAPWFYADTASTKAACKSTVQKAIKACNEQKKDKKGRRKDKAGLSKNWKKNHCGSLSEHKKDYDKKKKDALSKNKSKLEQLEKKVADTMKKVGGMKDSLEKMALKKAGTIAAKAGLKSWLGPIGWAWTAYDVVSAGVELYEGAKQIDKVLDELKKHQDEIKKIMDDSKQINKGALQGMWDEHAGLASKNACLNARKCILAPFDKSKNKGPACCDSQTGHHIVPNAMFQHPGTRKQKIPNSEKNISDCPGYDEGEAPIVCVEGFSQAMGTHKVIHNNTDNRLALKDVDNGAIKLEDAKKAALEAHSESFKPSCNKKCMKAQLDDAFKNACKSNKSKLRAVDSQGKDIKPSEKTRSSI